MRSPEQRLRCTVGTPNLHVCCPTPTTLDDNSPHIIVVRVIVSYCTYKLGRLFVDIAWMRSGETAVQIYISWVVTVISDAHGVRVLTCECTGAPKNACGTHQNKQSPKRSERCPPRHDAFP